MSCTDHVIVHLMTTRMVKVAVVVALLVAVLLFLTVSVRGKKGPLVTEKVSFVFFTKPSFHFFLMYRCILT